MSQLILASASPRRKQLLEQLGLEAVVSSVDIDESPYDNEVATEYVKRLAETKAKAVSRLHTDAVVLGADTIVVIEGNLLGKPRSKQHAFEMWQLLSNSWHQVITGVSLIFASETQTVLNISDVLFCEIEPDSMKAYWETGEPLDKAGAYAIQGYAARWVREIRGSYTGIMGLPLFETAELLNQAGIRTKL